MSWEIDLRRMCSKSFGDTHTHTFSSLLSLSPLLFLSFPPSSLSQLLTHYLHSSSVDTVLSVSAACLNGGEVAGIVIGCFLLLLIIVLLIACLVLRWKSKGIFIHLLLLPSSVAEASLSFVFLQDGDKGTLSRCRRPTLIPDLS